MADKQLKSAKCSYTYILRCADGTLYTGWTDDVAHREHIHNSGNGAKYTKSRLPVQVVYWEIFDSKQEAMKREYQIKQFSRKQKLALIDEGK
jgi:putative endonuclease